MPIDENYKKTNKKKQQAREELSIICALLHSEIKKQAGIKCRMKTVDFLNICASSNG